MQVIATRFACVEPDGFTDDEGDGFGFKLSRVTRAWPVVGSVQQTAYS
jgi:hypothetical protein